MEHDFCPLCNSRNIQLRETIKFEQIRDLYLGFYKIDVSYLFNDDIIEFCQCKDCSLKFFTKSAVGDGPFYGALQETDLYYMDSKEEYDFASKFINPDDSVLDIGCGKGAFSKKISSNNFTGLELSESAKEIAQKEGVYILNQTIQDHATLNKEKYDVVCNFQVLEHIDCKILIEFLQASVDCLKKGGLLIISVPSDDTFLSKMKNCILNLPPHHQTRWPDRAMKEIAKIFNLKTLELHHDALNPRQYHEFLSVNIQHYLTFNRKIVREKENILQKIYLKLPSLLTSGMRKSIINRIKPYGHSITAVYRK